VRRKMLHTPTTTNHRTDNKIHPDNKTPQDNKTQTTPGDPPLLTHQDVRRPHPGVPKGPPPPTPPTTGAPATTQTTLLLQTASLDQDEGVRTPWEQVLGNTVSPSLPQACHLFSHIMVKITGASFQMNVHPSLTRRSYSVFTPLTTSVTLMFTAQFSGILSQNTTQTHQLPHLSKNKKQGKGHRYKRVSLL
jgi:hypothetical protein